MDFNLPSGKRSGWSGVSYKPLTNRMSWEQLWVSEGRSENFWSGDGNKSRLAWSGQPLIVYIPPHFEHCIDSMFSYPSSQAREACVWSFLPWWTDKPVACLYEHMECGWFFHQLDPWPNAIYFNMFYSIMWNWVFTNGNCYLVIRAKCH